MILHSILQYIIYVSTITNDLFLFDYSEGSVVANCTILFQTIFINNVVVKYLFLAAIDNNVEPNGLKINKDFTKGKYPFTFLAILNVHI